MRHETALITYYILHINVRWLLPGREEIKGRLKNLMLLIYSFAVKECLSTWLFFLQIYVGLTRTVYIYTP